MVKETDVTGAVKEYAYNQGNMLTQMATTHPNQNYPVNEYAASYYMDGNLKLREGSQWADYTYDGLGRLIKDNGSMTTYYTYDAYGNISRKEQQLVLSEYEFTDYTYNANNQLVQSSADHFDYLNDSWRDITMTQYGYDQNGNLISETPQSRHLSGGTESISIGVLGELPADDTVSIKQYTYDGFGQRTSALTNDTSATYAYNPGGLRVSKTVNGETTTHILDGSNVVADVKGGNISKYNRGRGLISIEQNGNKGYYMFNGHGDAIKLVNSAGEEEYYNYNEFTAFGERIYGYNDDAPFDNPFGYAGEYTDRETDHIYLRARYYDPVTGRFTSEDPARDGNNWYSYAGNNPVMFFDPSGLAAHDPFSSYYDAALDWAAEYGAVTEFTGNEVYSVFYSYIDENGEEKFSYTKPFIGLTGYSDSELGRYTMEDLPDGRIATWGTVDMHSHPNSSNFSGELGKPSSGDKGGLKNGDMIFLLTPKGTIKVMYQKDIVIEDKETEICTVKTVWTEKELYIKDRNKKNPKEENTPIIVQSKPLSEAEKQALYAYLIDEVYLRNKNETNWTWPNGPGATGEWDRNADISVLDNRFTVLDRAMVQRN